MPIEVACPGCHRKLRIQIDGGEVRCPLCEVQFDLATVALDSSPSGPDEPATWRLRTPEGQTYGPVPRRELERWVREGRVDSECQLCEADGAWATASELFPVLLYALPPHRPQDAAVAKYRYIAPHRGSVVLALGIVSWLVGCPGFGVAAWVMGTSDLREMHFGRMDPRGRNATQAGRTLGMVHVLLLLLCGIVLLFATLFRLAIW